MVMVKIINEYDNVMVAIANIRKGTLILYEINGISNQLMAIEDIQMYHKIARNTIKKGEKIVKYGEYIGAAKEDILGGSHVHTHNVVSVKRKSMSAKYAD